MFRKTSVDIECMQNNALINNEFINLSRLYGNNDHRDINPQLEDQIKIQSTNYQISQAVSSGQGYLYMLYRNLF